MIQENSLAQHMAGLVIFILPHTLGPLINVGNYLARYLFLLSYHALLPTLTRVLVTSLGKCSFFTHSIFSCMLQVVRLLGQA